jgi:hypothetical protein
MASWFPASRFIYRAFVWLGKGFKAGFEQKLLRGFGGYAFMGFKGKTQNCENLIYCTAIVWNFEDENGFAQSSRFVFGVCCLIPDSGRSVEMR